MALGRLVLGATLCLLAPAAIGVDRDAAVVEKLGQFRETGIALYKKRCAKVLRTTRKSVANAHDPSVMDTIRTVHCPGLEISTYRANFSKPPTDIPGAVVLSGSNRELPFRLRVGSSRRAVETVFGAPDSEESGTADYHVWTEGPGADVVSFEYKDGRVKRVLWSFHIE